MKKRIIIVVLCIALLLTAVGVGVGASILASSNNLTPDDVRFLRGYAGEKGEWSISEDKKALNLNGSGVVSSAQKLVWDPSTTTTAGVVFTVTYNEDYTNIGDNYQDYRFAIALMDSQNFQGDAAGNGLGIEYRGNNANGGIYTMGFYYDGAENLGLQYPGRNNTSTATMAKTTTIKAKIVYEGGAWRAYYAKAGGDTIDTKIADFATSDAYYPSELFSGGEAYLVFGSYNANKMNMSITVDQTYGFSFVEDTTSEDYVTYTDTVERAGENIALEDNILTRFYVTYSSYDMIAKGGKVNLTCGEKSLIYNLDQGELLEGLTYGYTIPIPAALGAETITLTVTSNALDAEEKPVWSGTWSTTVEDYCEALKEQTTGTDEKSVALEALCDSIIDYCSKAKAYFDLANASN